MSTDTQPKSLEDAVSYNLECLVLCWDVQTPDGVISVSSQNRAFEIAEKAWPTLPRSQRMSSDSHEI